MHTSLAIDAVMEKVDAGLRLASAERILRAAAETMPEQMARQVTLLADGLPMQPEPAAFVWRQIVRIEFARPSALVEQYGRADLDSIRALDTALRAAYAALEGK